MNLPMNRGFKFLVMKGLVAYVFTVFVCISPAICNQTSASGLNQSCLTVKAGETWKITETTRLDSLTVFDGAVISVPEGYSLTMTVDGVETGQKLAATAGVDTLITPGIYRGDIVLTVAEANPMPYSGLTFPLRQALYLNENGIVEARSVLAAVTGNKPEGFDIDNITIKSTGECFSGIYVAGGSYTLNKVKINLSGNGRNDFTGYGAAIVAKGNKTRLVVDDVEINNIGVVRTALIADDGSNVIVKNSILKTMDGMLPKDYVGNADMAQMRGGFPIGGSLGNCRATNLLGTNTQSTYINSSIDAQGWGVLSTDGCTTPKLTAINSKISLTGNIGGYGTYAIGNATERFLGCEFNVAFDVTSLKGGYLFYGDSTPDAVARLNDELDLGLTKKELKAIPDKKTVINSERFGIVATGNGTVDISGGTIFNTGETLFLNKGASVVVTVDGSKGVQLNPGNGIVMQVMDGDDPGPSGKPYIESATPPERDMAWDLVSDEGAVTGVFSNIRLKGDFYNSVGWTKNTGSVGAGAAGGSGNGGDILSGGMSGGGMPGGNPGGSFPGGGAPTGGMPGTVGGSGKNMALTFDNADITGVISSSEAHHLKKELYVNEQDYRLFGVVTNISCEAVNNGVIVSLINKSNWTVTGTSYLTGLTLDGGSTVTAPKGYSIAMTIDGIKKAIGEGSYKGKIVLVVTNP